MKGLASALSARLARHLTAAGGARVDFALRVSLWVVGALVALLIAHVAWALWFPRRPAQRDDLTVSKLSLFIWPLVATGVAAGLFWLGYSIFLDQIVPPASAYEIQALSADNAWQFLYASGKTSVNRLVVPSDRPVRLILSSKDAPRSFFVPELGVEQSALPGRYTSLWFQAPHPRTLSIADRRDYVAIVTPAVLDVLDAGSFECWLNSRDPNRGSSKAK